MFNLKGSFVFVLLLTRFTLADDSSYLSKNNHNMEEFETECFIKSAENPKPKYLKEYYWVNAYWVNISYVHPKMKITPFKKEGFLLCNKLRAPLQFK